MKKKYQNAFFIFGLCVLILMITQLDFKQVLQGLLHAGFWFPMAVVLWAFLYLYNTSSWYLIIKGTGKPGESLKGKVPFWWLYKVTISGFALNYATPGGLMGGEPYRIMELAPRIGTERASSSVILYAMTHIFSHLWFWLISAVLFFIMRPVNVVLTGILLLVVLFCLLLIWFFMSGYRKGLANRVMNLLRHLPLVKKWARPFVDRHREQLDEIDRQIAALHKQNPRIFFSALLLELACRFTSALEILFILHALLPSVNFMDCVFILAFTSLFANLLFFMPLQLGGREGGFYLSATRLGITTSSSIFLALMVRLRELIWTGIGLLVIKIEKRRKEE